MDNVKIGHKTLIWLYDIFKDHFDNKELVIAGSFYYKKIGCDIETEYKDIDIVVDRNKDSIFHNIMDHIELEYDPISSFRGKYEEGFIGAFRINGYLGVDVLRNDFSNLKPSIEIIPGVWSYCLSDKVLYETYKLLEHKIKDPKYTLIKNFFHERALFFI